MDTNQLREMRHKVIHMQSKLGEALDILTSILGEHAANPDIARRLFVAIGELGALQAYGDGKLAEFQYVEQHLYSGEE